MEDDQYKKPFFVVLVLLFGIMMLSESIIREKNNKLNNIQTEAKNAMMDVQYIGNYLFVNVNLSEENPQNEAIKTDYQNLYNRVDNILQIGK